MQGVRAEPVFELHDEEPRVELSPEGPQRIAYRSKAHAAYQELRRRILEGELEAGGPLNQEQLASELGLSTTPLREALRSLETEGLVRTRTHKDVIVAPLDHAELLQLYQVRSHLDGLAARLAAENHDDEARERIEAAATELGHDHTDPVAANRRFHRSIYLASKNQVLISALDALWDRSDRYRRFTRGMADRQDVVAEHRAIADAVLSRDGKKAERMMLAHVREAEKAISTAVTQALAATDTATRAG
jgi:DNA-binding GntR family transcriptional regulator